MGVELPRLSLSFIVWSYKIGCNNLTQLLDKYSPLDDPRVWNCLGWAYPLLCGGRRLNGVLGSHCAQESEAKFVLICAQHFLL